MWVKFKQRCFQVTHVNRKWAFFLFNVSWCYQICVASVFTLSGKICPNICSKSPLKRAKFWFRLACTAQNRCCLNSYLHRLHISQCSLLPPPPPRKKSNTKIPASKTILTTINRQDNPLVIKLCSVRRFDTIVSDHFGTLHMRMGCKERLTVSLSASKKCPWQHKRPLPTPWAVNLPLICSHMLIEAINVVYITMFPVAMMQRILVHCYFWAMKHRWLQWKRKQTISPETRSFICYLYDRHISGGNHGRVSSCGKNASMLYLVGHLEQRF